MIRPLRSCIAVSVAAALIAAAPGPSAWAAAARVAPIKVNAPVGHGAHRTTNNHYNTLSLHKSGLGGVPKLTFDITGTPGLKAAANRQVDAKASRGALEAALGSGIVSRQAGIQTFESGTALELPGETAASIKNHAVLPGSESGERGGGPVETLITEGSYSEPSSRISTGLNALKRAFSGGKDAGAAGDGKSVSGKESSGAGSGLSKPVAESTPENGSSGVPPVPPSDKSGGDGGDNGGGGKSWFGLGKTAVMFIAALLVAQIGVEALGVAMPTLMQKTFGDFTAVAQLAIFSSIASIIGRQLGAVVVERFGLRKTYLGATAIRLLSMTALVTLLATGHMTLPLMIGFYSINGLLGGVAITAEASIPPALVGKDQAKIERFWTIEQTALEVLGFLGPIAFGSIVGGFGFMPALIAFPVTFAAALAVMFFTLRIPQKIEMAREADLKLKKELGKVMGVGSVFKQFFQRVGHGAKLVWRNPVLRTAFLAYTAIMILNPFLYSMIGPGYGLLVAGKESAELATSIGGWLTGLYSLGGLFGGLLMMREQAKLKKLPEAEQNERLRKSMLKWIKWTTFSLAALFTLAFPLPMLGALIPALPGWAGTLTLPALALIPYGIAQVISMVKLKSFFQSQVPDAEKDMPSAMGFFGSASLAVSTLGLLGLKYLFKGFDGYTPFLVIAGMMVPLALYYWHANRQLDKATRKSE